MLSLLGYGEAAFTLASLPGCGGRAGHGHPDGAAGGPLTWALFARDVGRPRRRARTVRARLSRRRLDRPTVYVAGGCGLAPLKAPIDHQLAYRRRGTPLAIVYGARTPATRILRGALAAWRGTPDVHPDRVRRAPRRRLGRARSAWSWTSWTRPCGPSAPSGPLSAGRRRMLAAVAARLGEAGLAPAAIHVALERYMKCGTGLCGHCYVNDRYVCTDGPVFSLAELATLPEAFID